MSSYTDECSPTAYSFTTAEGYCSITDSAIAVSVTALLRVMRTLGSVAIVFTSAGRTGHIVSRMACTSREANKVNHRVLPAPWRGGSTLLKVPLRAREARCREQKSAAGT